MQDAYAVDHIKGFRSKRERENISLERNKLAIRQVFRRDFHSRTQIDAHYAGSPASRYFCEAAHAASNIQHKFPIQVLPSEPGFHPKMVIGLTNFIMVKLSFLVTVPLKTET